MQPTSLVPPLANFLLCTLKGFYPLFLIPLRGEATREHFARKKGFMGNAKGNGLVSPIQDYLEKLHSKYVQLQTGDVANYIPELATANPDWFGICVATTDGQVYEVGDTRQPFTIQSISKPFVYGLALEDRGREAMLKAI